jgi:phytoene dehydrogenase-like protein
VISVGLSQPARNFGVGHYSTTILPDWMKALADFKQAGSIMGQPEGDRLPPFGLADYAQIESGLSEGAPYLCSMTGVDRLENWAGMELAEKRARKAKWMDRIIARVDEEFPGFAGAVVQRQMATASTMHRYLNTPGGAVYGFAPGSFTSSARTPVKGLYLASAWGMGGGYTGAMLGGAAAAREAMRLA